MATLAMPQVTTRPTHRGAPIVGSTFEWIRNPTLFNLGLYERYGPVVNVNYFFKDVVFLLGAEANERVLMARDDEFSNAKGWAQVSRLFAGGLMLLDFDKHLADRRIIQRAFSPANLARYLHSLRAILDEHTLRLPSRLGIRGYQQLKQIMVHSASATFLGLDDREESLRMNDRMIAMLEAAVAVSQVNFPGTTFARGMKARDYLKRRLASHVLARKSSSADDLFTQLCLQSTAADSDMSEEDVVEHIIFIIMAAHDTTASMLSSLTMELALNPQWQTRVRDELLSLPDAYGLDDLQGLKITEAVIDETLRRHPPVPDIPRMTTKETEVLGYTLPKDTRLVISPCFTHHFEGYWDRPFTFDPDRFLSGGRTRESRMHWLPFGSGVHKCMGLHFTYLESKIFLRALLKSFTLHPASEKRPEWQHVPFPHPKADLWLEPRTGGGQ
jgi:cytochrome P450